MRYIAVPDFPPIQKILSQLGLNKSLQKVKFGGVVGKQTLLGIVGAAVLCIIAWRTPVDGVMIAGMALLLVLVIAGLNFRFADKHPVEAMMEGTEMLALQHQAYAAKTITPPKTSEVIPNPQGNPPENEPTEGPDT